MPEILIVDDDPDFVEITRTILEAKGYRIESAGDADEAMKSIRNKKPDLVLLDIMMAGILDGLKVTSEMHNDPGLRRVPIIVVSSIGNSPNMGDFPTDEYLNVSDWISKPVQPDELLKKVKLYLQRSKR